MNVLSGAPVTSTRELWSQSEVIEGGVWAMTPGTARDIEAAEIFVVLAGQATITIGDVDPRAASTGKIVSSQEGTRPSGMCLR